ncbi:MAG: ribonuclease HII [Verrucomicrobiae bacterium]|nr:ribonuclease HII [Verrucomicrobiae bacterium]MCX7721761.1 ribonuclease HII [Verrucomicrobiae bacterium]MDW7980718.1 ribonuclease HII [Verrucomicrobiales bacterium]
MYTEKSDVDKFRYERALLRTGVKSVAGVDEAGRGPLAGPVVAAAVVLPAEWIAGGAPPELTGLTDSKQLSARQRERYFDLLTRVYKIRFATAQVEAHTIDSINILRATHHAMMVAVAKLEPAPEHVLVDGKFVPTITIPQTAIIGGDALSFAIAAASIIAKVTRDRLMLEYDKLWPMYGFAQHKGYGTAQHMAALAQFGPCPIHRRSFAPVRAFTAGD